MSDENPPKNNISSKAGVIGFPVSQSLSPIIHREWLRREGKNGDYDFVLIPDTRTAFNQKLQDLRKTGYKGVNVTLPHKQNALESADQFSPEAALAGAANMLSFEKDHVFADNSDHLGFQNALKAKLLKTSKLNGELTSALLLGAGGASGAVLIALIKSGFSKIYICNRTIDKARALQKRVGKIKKGHQSVETIPWDKRQSVDVDLVVNTTSLGMKNNPELDFEVGKKFGHKIIADIVYSPLETKLLKDASSMGLVTIDGLSMLMHQAVPGYLRWLGDKAVVDDELRDLLINNLAKKVPMKVIGLTGSIGMGKSTIGGMFAQLGYPLWDADSAVHRLYQKGGDAVNPVGVVFPDAIVNGRIDREKLSVILKKSPDKFKQLEKIVHPLVAKDREYFLEQQRLKNTKLCILDIPLLFENNSEHYFDKIIVVSASAETQRKRVLGRNNMSEEKFNLILSKQMPDSEKRSRADFIIDTDQELDKTKTQVSNLIQHLEV